jgi:glycosyltransferase involved in cell wall biosynthesis
MRIALSTSVVQGGRSGVAQYVFGLIKALLPVAGQHDIHLLVLEEDIPLFSFAAHRVTILPIKGVRSVNPLVGRLREPLTDIAWHQCKLPALLRKHRIDVVHIPCYRRMLYSAPCAMVTTIHDLGLLHIKRNYEHDWARRAYARVIVRRLAARQHKIIAVSENTAQDVAQFFSVEPERIDVIYNGLDQDRFGLGNKAQAKADVERRWNLSRPFFLYVSRLENPAKNHVRLIEAFNQFKATSSLDWQLVLAGSDWHGASAIHAKAAQSPYSHDIRFLGFVEDATLPSLYRAAGAMVYPSLFEGFGMPPVEAALCGCPVLSSRRGALDEVLGGSAGTFDPECVEEIAAALTRLAVDPEWSATLRDAGLRNARRFSWRENAEHVLDVYQRAVDFYRHGRALSSQGDLSSH